MIEFHPTELADVVERAGRRAAHRFQPIVFVQVHASVDAAGILRGSLLGFGELLREPSRSPPTIAFTLSLV